MDEKTGRTSSATYGAAIVAVLSAALYFVFQTGNKAALAPFGLDPSGFSGSTAEMIGGGVGTLLIFGLIILALYRPIGWPVPKMSGLISGWYIGKYGKSLVYAAICSQNPALACWAITEADSSNK